MSTILYFDDPDVGLARETSHPTFARIAAPSAAMMAATHWPLFKSGTRSKQAATPRPCAFCSSN
ncbi:hypothetical protein [Comamonas thiooxydans]|uniref:hypothetical protein n=1 Tax=Comamonas thiooxydans TaxID=363952 RepID=UPI003D01BF11